MTRHTIFGDATPTLGGSGTVTVSDDGLPSIQLGNYFYVYGALSSGWLSSGGRVYIPDDARLVGQEIQISLWKTTSEPIAMYLETPFGVGTATVPAGGGWVEAMWDAPVPVGVGEMLFVGYRFTSDERKMYYMAFSGAVGNPFIRSVDNVDVVLAENPITTLTPQVDRGYFEVNNGTGSGISAAWYGVDIIVTDTANTEGSLLAEYGFNETSGTTAADSSGNGYNLTLNSESNLGMSHAGNGLHQVGAGLANRISHPAPWFGAASRTLALWGRYGSTGTGVVSQSVYQLNNGGDVVFGISISSSSVVTFTTRHNNTEVLLTAPTVTTGSWAHYALTFDGAQVRAYIDDLLVASQAVANPIDSSDGEIYFFGGEYHEQVLDDVRFYSEALSLEQVMEAMNNPVTPADTEPPTAPTNLSVAVSGQQVTLNWDASVDNIGIQNYVVYRGATPGFTPAPELQVGGPASTTHEHTAPQGEWYFQVTARDEAGNESTASNEVSVTVAALDDIYFKFPSDLGFTTGTEIIDEATNPGGMTFGVLFALSSQSEIAGIRFYSTEAQAGINARLYENGNDISVISKLSVDVVQGWNVILFDAPYIGNVGMDYEAVVYLPAPYSYSGRTDPGWPTPGNTATVGPMYTGVSESSRYTPNDLRPINGATMWYGVDALVLKPVESELDPTFGATIEAENAKTGSPSSEWSILGAGDTSNLGFAREFSVNAGETIDFSCHGPGEVLDIYRIGYYGGLGWRRVATLENTATMQPDPNIIPNSNGGVECSNWSTTASWSIPAEALSGLFVGVYRNTTKTNASYIPFVVRNDSRIAKVAYKTSDTTWALAYNYYGTPSSPLTGKSVYGSGGPLGNIGTRTHAVSYHRPIVTREGIPQTYWLACEAPMIRFMERNGIDMKYIASRDIDAGMAAIANTSIAMSSGHDEYWSEGMRDAAEAYRDNGGHLLFFSGNEVFWRTRFDAGRQTMWCYKDTMQGPGVHVAGTPLDPVSWTGTWKDMRFAGRRPENTLTGTDFRMNGVHDFAVTFPESTHPFWRFAPVTSGPVTVAGIIGFEADELAPTQPEGSYVVLTNHTINIDGLRADDNGQEYNSNGDLAWGVVSQRYASGAVVVGFGTCQWSWGLDVVHDRGGNYVDQSMQQATLNLFADLGAEPATPMSTLSVPVAVTSLDVYGAIPLPTRSGNVKVWDGSVWQSHPLKVWDGSSWVKRPVSGHDGTQYKIGK